MNRYPGLRDMFAPAEEVQAEADECASFISPRLGVGLLGLTVVLIGLHWAWSMSL